MAQRKICLKCLLEVVYCDGDKYCTYCGGGAVDLTLICECGKEIMPNFWPNFFPPWGKHLINRHCSSCGIKVEKRIWDWIKLMRKCSR